MSFGAGLGIVILLLVLFGIAVAFCIEENMQRREIERAITQD